MKEFIYQSIVKYKAEHDGNAPPFSYVAAKLKISKTAVKYWVDRDPRLYWKDGDLCVRGGRWSLTNLKGEE